MGAARGIDWGAVEDLGKVPDKVIADRLGVLVPAVWAARKKLGIPTFKRVVEHAEAFGRPDERLTPAPGALPRAHQTLGEGEGVVRSGRPSTGPNPCAHPQPRPSKTRKIYGSGSPNQLDLVAPPKRQTAAGPGQLRLLTSDAPDGARRTG